MNLLNRHVMDFGFGLAEFFENRDGGVFCRLVDLSFADDLANLREAATVVVSVMMAVRVRVFVGMRTLVSVECSLRQAQGRLCPTASGQILFSVHDHINLGCADSATTYAQDFQMRADVECGDSFLKKIGRDSCVNQRGEKHVAA